MKNKENKSTTKKAEEETKKTEKTKESKKREEKTGTNKEAIRPNGRKHTLLGRPIHVVSAEGAVGKTNDVLAINGI